MLGWFKRKRVPEPPSVRHKIIGEVDCRSPVLLLDDPSIMHGQVRVENIPVGRHSVLAKLITYPEGATRVATISIEFRPGGASERRTLGSIGVDSAQVVAIDEKTFQAHWKEVGPDRIGRTGIFKKPRRFAKLLGDRFGLSWREINPYICEFVEPISEELAARITEFLKTFPEYADYPFMHFSIRTNNSFDRVCNALKDRVWCQLVLDEYSGAELFAVTSGFGDGSYQVDGWFEADELRSIVIEFIGPAQDSILEAFPILRY